MDVLQQCTSTPILGVCLGLQALAVAAGGRVVCAPEPVHGRLSTLQHSSNELFVGCPSGPGSGFDVVRCVESNNSST
jgi:para-aminobenzoate synthetase